MKRLNKKWIQPLRWIVQTCFMAGLFVAFVHPQTVARWPLWTLLFVGVFFCGWVCPFGTVQDWLGWCAVKCRLPRFKVPRHIQKYLQFSRYLFLGLMFWGITFSFSNAPFYFQNNLMHHMLSWASGLTLTFFLIAGLFCDRPFCNYFCLKGAADGLVSMFRLISIHRDNNACIHCHLCDKVCPMNVSVEKTGFVRHPNCINCMKCVGVCPKNCLKYRLMRIHLNKKYVKFPKAL